MSEIRLSISIMAVPERVGHIKTMLARLSPQIERARSAGLDVSGPSVFYDQDKKGPWHCWRGAWLTNNVYDSTHHAVLQDDILFCEDLPETLVRLAEARPDSPISGFLPRKSTEKAFSEGKLWVRTKRFLWGQCLVMPTKLGNDMVEWADMHEGSEIAQKDNWKTHDDVRLASYYKLHKVPVFVAVPHPVEHIGDELGSVLGHHGPPGRRRARAWVGEDKCGAHLGWDNLDFVSE